VNNHSPVDLGFSYRQRKTGVVELLRHRRLASILRGAAAQDFLAKVESSDPPAAQRLMAKLTGNYKRGNERRAYSHSRNRK
jgi:hypothetical protein